MPFKKFGLERGLTKIFLLETVRFLTLNDQCYHHIETSQLICRVKQLAGFYMLGTLVVKSLIGGLEISQKGRGLDKKGVEKK